MSEVFSEFTTRSEQNEKCVWCRFYQALFIDSEGLTDGECRRHAPSQNAGWPHTKERRWCGEFAWSEKEYSPKQFPEWIRDRIERRAQGGDAA